MYGNIEDFRNPIQVISDHCHALKQRASNAFRRLAGELELGRTLVCIGYNYSDLTVAASFLRDARNESQASLSQCFAILPELAAHEANELLHSHGIIPVSLGSRAESATETLSRFLDCIHDGLSGRDVNFIPPGPLVMRADETASEAAGKLRDAESRLTAEGFHTARKWFLGFPNELPLPDDPPANALLNSVFVERQTDDALHGENLKDWVKARLSEGSMAGLTGLLGIGGVGKTYLAMRIAWEMKDEGWEVVWVSLQEKGTGEAFDQLADVYGLTFIGSLKDEEKALALQWYFKQLKAQHRRPVVILDNAERFPNLPLLLQPLMGLPVLVTSRTQECSEIVRYRRLSRLTNDESLDLCRQLLSHNIEGAKLFAEFSENDRNDLAELCEFLGGHPLGIRLAIAGFLRLPRRKRLGQRPFRTVLEEVRARGAEALPASMEPDTGRAGERIHQTIYSTFEWLFHDLGEVSGDVGKRAQLLLPVIAVLGAVPVSNDMLEKTIKELDELCNGGWQLDLPTHEAESGTHAPEDYFALALGPTVKSEDVFLRPPSPPQTAVEHARLEVDDRDTNTDEGTLTNLGDGVERPVAPLPDNEPAPPPPGTVASKDDGYDDEDLKILKEVGDYRFGDIMASVRCRSIQFERHNTTFDEKSFVRKLRRSISLRFDEKRRFLAAIPNLSQFQIDEFIKILDDEFQKFCKLSPKHLLHLKKLEHQHATDWYILEASLETPRLGNALDFQTQLGLLQDDDHLKAAWDELENVGLIETERATKLIRIHPLIREFAFAERSRAETISVYGQKLDYVTTTGPSVLALLAAGTAVLSDDPEQVASFVDLLPRMKRIRFLAEPACDAAWKLYEKLEKSDEWIPMRELLAAAWELADSIGEAEKSARFRVKLGELLDRMGEADGVGHLQAGCRILTTAEDEKLYRDILWARAYLDIVTEDGEMHSHVRVIYKQYREMLCDTLAHKSPVLFELIEGHIRRHVDETPASMQMDLCTSSTYLSNLILSLTDWVETFCRTELDREFVLCAHEIFASATSPSEDKPRQSDSLFGESTRREPRKPDVSPEHLRGIERAIVTASEICDTTLIAESMIDFDRVLEEARKFGIRGFQIQRSRFQVAWVKALKAGNWQDAVHCAANALQSASESNHVRQEYSVLNDRCHLIASHLACYDVSVTKLAQLERELNQIDDRARFWGRNDLLGWIFLCKALAEAHRLHSKVRDLSHYVLQARAVFARFSPGPVKAAELLLLRAVALGETDESNIGSASESVNASESWQPDYRPWQLDRFGELPRCVRAIADGKRMSLVHGGLQMGPSGKEIWLYPFYIDEEPVTFAEFETLSKRNGQRFEVLSSGNGYVLFPELSHARIYAKWTNKQIPQIREWHAATWQLAAGNSPEVWPDWVTARDRMIHRIKNAIDGKIENPHEKLPAGATAGAVQDDTESSTSVDSDFAVRSEMTGVWSGMTARSKESVGVVLLGDPLLHPEWLGTVEVTANSEARKSIGMRCVIPLYTIEDMKLVEVVTSE